MEQKDERGFTAADLADEKSPTKKFLSELLAKKRAAALNAQVIIHTIRFTLYIIYIGFEFTYMLYVYVYVFVYLSIGRKSNGSRLVEYVSIYVLCMYVCICIVSTLYSVHTYYILCRLT